MKTQLTILFIFISLIGYSQLGFYKLEKDPNGIYIKKGNGCTSQDTTYSVQYAATTVHGGSWNLFIENRTSYTYPNHGWYCATTLSDALIQMGINVNEWEVGKMYMTGNYVQYLSIRYKCIQNHTSQSDWIPPSTPTLWTVVPVNNNWTIGVAYKVNDIVIYIPNSFNYKCLQARTSQATWTPPAVPALWQKQ